MTILLTGGGSGGHITPLLAVAHKLKDKSPDIKLWYAGERKSRFAHISETQTKLFDRRSVIYAGKFRRYHGESWMSRLTDVSTLFLNLRDFIYLLFGFTQSLILLVRSRPDFIFIKGGYVGLPIGLAAIILRIPYITHDSDAASGLTNRILGQLAKYNGVGFPTKFYRYSNLKAVETGVPISEDFKSVSASGLIAAKKALGFPTDSQVLLVTGGSNGARRINQGMVAIVSELLQEFPNIIIVHQVGKGNMNQYQDFRKYDKKRLIAKEFINDIYRYSAAADLIVTRAGASAIAEYSAQGKACIVVPSPLLSGGHQLKNARLLAKADAAVLLTEAKLSDPSQAHQLIKSLLKDPGKRHKLADNLSKFMKQDASSTLSNLLVKSARDK